MATLIANVLVKTVALATRRVGDCVRAWLPLACGEK
jgi:hypothetical protein